MAKCVRCGRDFPDQEFENGICLMCEREIFNEAREQEAAEREKELKSVTTVSGCAGTTGKGCLMGFLILAGILLLYALTK